MTYSSDPLESASAGVAKGVLSWTKEEILSYVNKFKNKKLAFIGDNATIQLVKEYKKSGEWKLYNNYIRKEFRVLVQMGLALRKLEKKPEHLEELREKIKQKYGKKGLYVAQMIQNEVLTSYLMLVVPANFSEKKIKEYINELLKEINKYVVFVKSPDKATNRAMEVKTKLHAYSPQVLIVFGSKSAKDVAKEVTRLVVSEVESYTLKQVEDSIRYMAFFMEDVEEF